MGTSFSDLGFGNSDSVETVKPHKNRRKKKKGSKKDGRCSVEEKNELNRSIAVSQKVVEIDPFEQSGDQGIFVPDKVDSDGDVADEFFVVDDKGVARRK